MFHVPYINQMYNIFKKKTNKCTWMYELLLLHNNHRNIFDHSCGHPQGGGKKSTSTNRIFFKCRVVVTHYNCICVLVLVILRRAT